MHRLASTARALLANEADEASWLIHVRTLRRPRTNLRQCELAEGMM